MTIDTVITISHMYYYKSTFEDSIDSIARSDFVSHEIQKYTFDLFHSSRLSPRLRCYHFCLDNGEYTLNDAISEAKKNNIVVFSLDIRKLNLPSKIIEWLIKKDESQKYYRLTEVLKNIQKTIDNMLDEKMKRKLQNIIDDDSMRQGRKTSLVSFKALIHPLTERLEEVEKATNLEKEKKSLKKLLNFLETVSGDFRNIIFALNKTRSYLCIPTHMKDAMVLDKKIAPIELAQKLIKLWLLMNLEGTSSHQFAFLNPMLIIGRDCVSSLVFPINATWFNVRTGSTQTPKAIRSINQAISTLAALYRIVDLNQLLFQGKRIFFDSSVTSSSLQKGQGENRNKIYEFENFYHLFMKFIGVDNSNVDDTYKIAQGVAYEHSFSYHDLPSRSAAFPQFDPTRDERDNLIRSISHSSGHNAYFNLRRLIVACRDYDLLGKNMIPAVEPSHAYRYQAYKEYWQIVTSSIYSSLSIGANYLCGMLAATIIRTMPTSLRAIAMHRNFSSIASRISAEYGETTMFKRVGGVQGYNLVFEHDGVQENENETRASISGIWENANITISDRYNRISIALSVCACILAMLSIGNVVDVAIQCPICNVYDFFSVLIASGSFWGAFISFLVSIVLSVVWILYGFCYQKHHPLHSYIENFTREE